MFKYIVDEDIELKLPNVYDAEWLNDRYVNHVWYGLLKSQWK